MNQGSMKWKTLLVMFVLAIAMWQGWSEVWGVLFIYWGILAIKNREVFLVENILAKENPILFTIIVGFWLVTGVAALLWQGDRLTASAQWLARLVGA